MTIDNALSPLHELIKKEILPGRRLSDVIRAVADGACHKDGTGPADLRRKEIIRDIKRIGRMMERDLEDIPADTRWLKERFGDWCPARLGVSPAIATRLKSSLNVALSLAGTRNCPKHDPLELSVVWNTLQTAMDVAVKAAILTNPKYSAQTIRPFIRYCNALNIAPSAVTESTLSDYVEQRMASALSEKWSPASRLRQIRMTWNRLSNAIDIWPDPLVVPETQHLRLSMDVFPDSLSQDCDRYLASHGVRHAELYDPDVVGYAAAARARVAAKSAVVTEDDGRKIKWSSIAKPLKDVTAQRHVDVIRLAASALVRSGISPTELRSITDVATPTAAIAIVDEHNSRHQNKKTATRQTLVKALASVAERWTDVTTEQRELFWGLKKVVEFRPTKMPETDRTDIAPFLNDIELIAKVVRLPVLTFRALETKRKKTGVISINDAREAEKAIMLLLVYTLPVRRRTLSETALSDISFPRRPGAEGSVAWESEATKTKKPLLAGLAGWKCDLIKLYCEHYRPLLTLSPTSRWLFPGRRSHTAEKCLSAEVVAINLKKFVYDAVGLPVRSHLWRKIFAGVLSAVVENDKVVSALLGHSENSRVTELYVDGLRTRSAARTLDRVMSEMVTRVLGDTIYDA